MARTSNIYVRVEPNIKEQAEVVLENSEYLCLMLYLSFKTGCNAKRFAFDVKIPNTKPLLYQIYQKQNLIWKC